MKFCSQLSSYKCHCADTWVEGYLQNFRHFFAKGETISLVKTETDFHELYPTVGKNEFSLATEINLICNDQGHK